MTGEPGKPPLFSLALLSAAALGGQVLWLRVMAVIQWHHFAFMIISLALLGYGASGTALTLSAQPDLVWAIDPALIGLELR